MTVHFCEAGSDWVCLAGDFTVTWVTFGVLDSAHCRSWPEALVEYKIRVSKMKRRRR